MVKRLVTLLIFFFSLMTFISCEKESSGDENLKDYRSTVEPTGQKDIEYFFFVGKTGRETGLYKYNLNKNKYKLFWSVPKETVVQLSYSDNLEYAFFITAKRLGTKRGVSFIRDIKLYRLDLQNSSVALIREIGDAVQLFADWLDNNYKIQFTRFDMKIASRINKINQIYSPFGKLIKEDIEIFDFIKDGYPQFEIRRSSLISPSGNFGIAKTADSVFLSISGVEGKVFIDSTGRKINKVKWNSDESFVFFTANSVDENKLKKMPSTIYVYDVVNQKIVKKWEGEYKMNFIIVNELLIFDTSFNNRSAIGVYDYRKNEDINIIKIRGSSGLFNIPYQLIAN
ncbi:MAG: hypothetical protein BMS9Abin39_0334 [Ignavibacteria bacterium]|nr:MAG: hypothetical protein BMS9Abin39_0334 [Ignavibacteria bacterium]